MDATTTKPKSMPDPHEILRAAIEYKSSNASSSVRSSTLSPLYPPVESVQRAAGDFDPETDWYNANGSDKKSSASTTSKNDGCRQVTQSSEIISPAAEQSPGLTEAEAAVTIVDDGMIHPLEAESVVQAELVNQVENGHGREQKSRMNGERHRKPLNGPDNTVSGRSPSNNTEIATEATVIASGPEEKATRAAWAGDSTEAVVLPSESHSTTYEDKKCSSLQNEDVVMVETISEGLSAQNFANESGDADMNMVADAYAESINHSAQAELIRNSSTNNLSSNGVGDDCFDTVAVVNDGETPCEATVLDCGPLDKATIPAWSTAEVAQVLPTRSVSVSIEDEEQKVIPCTDNLEEIQGTVTTIGNRAEILKISEEFHPAELETESATTAELIGNPGRVISDSGRIYDNGAMGDNILKEETNQTPLIPAIPEIPEIPEPQSFSEPQPFACFTAPSSTNDTDSIRSESTLQSVQIPFSELEFCVSPRTLLPSSVYYAEETQSWRATLSTVQKAYGFENTRQISQGIRAFDVRTQKQAICLAKAWTPPTMKPFSENPECHICKLPFNYIRRACHCRNCGVCICFCCIAQWPSKMIPQTYNIKDESTVNICKACDWLCSEFRLALLNGDCDKAIALYNKGNINLTTPFANIKGEVFYPVHCAVLGKSLWLLKWLIEDNCCQMKSTSIGNGERAYRKNGYRPILTSKSRSLLNIALSNNSVDIIRYLVLEKDMVLQEEKTLPVETLLEAIDSILRAP